MEKQNVVLAVSGGVDSMVMMDFFCKVSGAIVAHFNHGTRPSADDDEKFVVREAKKRGLKVVVGHGNLGENVSEEKARAARYKFLRKVAQEHYTLSQVSESMTGEVKMRKDPAVIWTAHHINDLVETMAINLLRGTGWRGVAPFGNQDVQQPFLEPFIWMLELRDPTGAAVGETGEWVADALIGAAWDKQTILKYAAVHKVPFREDPTNHEDKYLRGRIRPLVSQMDRLHMRRILALWLAQQGVKAEIEHVSTLAAAALAGGHLIVDQGEGVLLDSGAYIRKGDDPEERAYYADRWYEMGFGDWLDGKPQAFPRVAFQRMQERGNGNVALEILRAILTERGIRTTRPQREEFLEAILTYQSGKKFNLPGGKMVKITKDKFYL